MTAQRKCALCGEALLGRCDQKFCSDACRSEYHNRGKQPLAAVVSTHRILRKNRRILEDCFRAGRRLVPREWLLSQGFCFGFCTRQQRQFWQNSRYFCYEFSYQKLVFNKIKIEQHN